MARVILFAVFLVLFAASAAKAESPPPATAWVVTDRPAARSVWAVTDSPKRAGDCGCSATGVCTCAPGTCTCPACKGRRADAIKVWLSDGPTRSPRGERVLITPAYAPPPVYQVPVYPAQSYQFPAARGSVRSC